MALKRIFIISSYAMFGHGLESLLRQEDEFEIVGQETEIERAIEQIKKLKPDVVILDNDEPAYDSTSPVLRRILKEHLEAKVIGLSLQNNKLYIYTAMQLIVKSEDDLKTAIKYDAPLFTRPNHGRTRPLKSTNP